MTHARRLLFAALPAVLLHGCDLLPVGGSRTLAMLDGSLTAVGPQGYCIDRAASDPAAGFAVLGDCALFPGLGGAQAIPGLITLQLGPAGSAAVTGAETALVDLLRSNQGAALLARDGQAATVTVLGVESGPGIVLVHLADSAAPIVAGLEAQEWRAFLDLQGHMATVTLRGFARAPLDRAAALTVMSDAARMLRAANRPDAPPA